MISDAFFEQIQQHFDSDLPFVVYRKPQASVKALLQKDPTLHVVNDFAESGFVMAPFNSEEKSILIPLEFSELVIPAQAGIHTEQKSFIDNELPDVKLSEVIERSRNAVEMRAGIGEKQQHINLIQNGIDAINNNQFKKVVLSRCETVTLSENNPIEIFKRLLNEYESAFVYCWYHPKVGLWLGATPETLLKIEGTRFETMALAGTQTYHGSLDVDWGHKDIEEQQIVTDSIVANLESVTERFKVSDVKTVKAGNLLHLKTSISGTLNFKPLNSKLLLTNLHPTPAVCGFPKEDAKQFILNKEDYHREFYTGFLGELNLKETRSRNTNRRNVENNAYASVKIVTNLFVNLRCMQLKANQAFIYVGGGVTKDSIPEKEWEETVNKAKTIKNVLVN
jgi:isochorismate synthase